MKHIWKKYILLFCVAFLSLALPVAAEEPVSPETEPAELLYFDGEWINLDVTDWALPGSGISFFSTPAYEQMKVSLLEQVQEREEWVRIENTSNETYTVEMVEKLYFNALYDYPEETYFVRTHFSYYDRSYAPGETIELWPVYLDESTYDPEAYEAAVDAAVEACFTEDMTELEKVVAAHDWIVLNCQYDPYVAYGRQYTTSGGVTYKSDPRVYTSYGPFAEQNAVCQGYALAFQVLMNRVGLPCCFVNGEGHAWNAVQLDGDWYYVDATWGDPIGKNATGDYYGGVSREHFLMGETTFAATHASCKDWSTEYGYTISSSDYALPEGLAGAADMAAYRNDDAFYLISDGYLCRYDVGGDFTNGTTVISDELPKTIALVAAAMDWDNQTLYYSCSYSNVSYIFAVNMVSGEVEKIFETWTDPRGRGLKLVQVEPGIKELWVWYDYTAEESIWESSSYTSVNAGDYSYYAEGGTVYIKPEEGAAGTVILVWYGDQDKFLEAEFCAEQASYKVPAKASLLKIFAVENTTAWIPLCAAEDLAV